MRRIFIFLIVFVGFICTCASGKKFVQIYFPDGDSVTAELAVSLEEKERGLMFRKKIAADEGMLFVYERSGFHSFWMKNTLIPLDMLWLDWDKRIIHIERNVPPCKTDPCPSYAPEMPGLYVLELKAGSVDQRGLKMYDKLDFILPKELQK